MKLFLAFAFHFFFFTTLTLACFPEWAQEKYFNCKDREDFKRYLRMKKYLLDKEFEKYEKVAFPPRERYDFGPKRHKNISSSQQQTDDIKREYALNKLFIIANARLHKKSEHTNFTVDLHGQTPDSLSLIYSRIVKVAQEQYRISGYSPSFACVYFITGKGNHSAVKGKCVLKEKLDVLLREDKLRAIQLSNSGIIGVRLNIPQSDGDSLGNHSSLESSIAYSSSDESAFMGEKRTNHGKFHLASNSSQNVPVCASVYGSSSSYYDHYSSSASNDEGSLPQRKHFKSNLLTPQSSCLINSVNNEISLGGEEHLKKLSENYQSQSQPNNPWLMKNRIEKFVKKGFQVEEDEFPPMNINSSMKRKLNDLHHHHQVVEDSCSSWEDENEMDGTFRENQEDLDQTFIA